MVRPKPERWLPEGFAEGVVERDAPACWIVDHDLWQRPCSGRLEVFHFIARQRVENAMWDALREALEDRHEVWALIHLGAWDPRNGGLACADEHHPRFDKHRMPPLEIHALDLPEHVLEFASDYGLEEQLGKFPGAARLELPPRKSPPPAMKEI